MKQKNNYYREYINEILKLFPNVSSGRKNYSDHQKRIDKIFKLINKYKENKSKWIKVKI